MDVVISSVIVFFLFSFSFSSTPVPDFAIVPAEGDVKALQLATEQKSQNGMLR